MICQETAEDRQNHITAIENTRNKKIFDDLSEYQTYVIAHHGKDEYNEFIHRTKETVFENASMSPKEAEIQVKLPKYMQLEIDFSKWEEIRELHFPKGERNLPDNLIHAWIGQCSKAR